ncbi:synaptotagmin-10 [Grus japonensis]|uniref:Synaptotagmin-10 n=1 Tax=Grus japonensis TaxID=30415 RepID=A0ABC9VUY9_GRUJA
MSFPAEDGVGSLCHKALQIISELCLGGQVEREKCAGIFPLETARQGIGGTDTRVPFRVVAMERVKFLMADDQGNKLNVKEEYV